MTKNRPARTYSFRTWGSAVALSVALVAAVAVLLWFANAMAPKEGRDFRLDLGQCTPAGTVGGQADMTVTNLSSQDIRVKVSIEYRDGAGRLVDSDTADIEVRARDSVVHREVTLFPGAEQVRTCPVTDVDASWS